MNCYLCEKPIPEKQIVILIVNGEPYDVHLRCRTKVEKFGYK